MEQVLNYIWLIPLFPLLGFIIIGSLGRKFFMGKTELVPAVIGIGTSFLSFVMSVLCVLALRQLPANEEGVVVFTNTCTKVSVRSLNRTYGPKRDTLNARFDYNGLELFFAPFL